MEVLRVGVSREAWQCLTDDAACSVADASAGGPLQGGPQLAAAQLAGDYKVFDLSAVPVEETDPFTGATHVDETLVCFIVPFWDLGAVPIEETDPFIVFDSTLHCSDSFIFVLFITSPRSPLRKQSLSQVRAAHEL